MVEEFKILSVGHSVVGTKSFEVKKCYIPTQLKRKHLHPEVSYPNSMDLSVKRKRLVRWQDLEKNTVFKQPPYLLWLERDGLLVSPYPLDCYVVDLVKKNVENIGPKWAIFSDKDSNHFFEECLEVSVYLPLKG